MQNKKHNWIKYNRNGMKCEIKVLDEDNRKLDFFRFLVNDKKTEKKIGEILRKSYGIKFNLLIDTNNSINNK